MKKFLALMLILSAATLATASPMIKLGDINGVFALGNTNVSTVAAGGLYEVYVWASSDRALSYYPEDDPDFPGEVIPSSGVDNFQFFLQYNAALVNLDGGLISKIVAINPSPMYATPWSGRTQGTFGGLNFCEGALIPAANADVFGMTKIAKVIFKVATIGANTKVTLTADASLTHQSKIGNSAAGLDFFAASGANTQSVTFVPEPATLMILGLGGLLLRKRG